MILKRFKYLMIVIFVFVSACSAKTVSPTIDVVNTGGRSSTEQSPSSSEMPAATNTTEPSPAPTLAPTPTSSPEPSPTEQPAMTSTPVVEIPVCTNRATVVRHLSFANGSSILTGMFFGKAWRIQNTGTCTWTTDYSFVFASGEQLGAPAETPLLHEVRPGDTIDIQVTMVSPDVANSYTGDWMLRDPNGILFGTGETADQPIEVQIVVKQRSTKDFHPFPECG